MYFSKKEIELQKLEDEQQQLESELEDIADDECDEYRLIEERLLEIDEEMDEFTD